MDRKELARDLDDWMSRGYAKLRATGRLAFGRNLLKSYLIEANTDATENGRNMVSIFFAERLEANVVTVTETDDPTIHWLETRRSNTMFYLDTLDSRFWLLHTTAQAQEADAAVRNLVQRTPMLDAAWLPANQLASWSSELGTPRLLTAKFSVPTGLYQDDLPEEEFLDESLFLKIGSTGNALERWNEYRKAKVLSPSMALWAARVTRRRPNRDEIVIEDLTATGKLTCRGNSFGLHQEFLHGLRSRYAQLITNWEGIYRTGWHRQANFARPTGIPAEIRLPAPLDDEGLERLLGSMFNCGEPYRLYGVPVQQGDQRYVTKAVDLHTGDKIDFEITPEVVRVYMFATTCGNTLARLLTNLQHFHDARVNLG
jgi:hypothetical protein